MAEIAIAGDVATTAETWTPSRRMRAAAAAERERVERELGRLSARENVLASELTALRRVRADLEHQLNVLNHFAHAETKAPEASTRSRRLHVLPAPGNDQADGITTLRGAHIRETAVRVLAASHPADAPVHYRDWFELLTAQGFMPTGKDPLATFLTQVGRSPVVRRSSRAGIYVLDSEFPRRATEKLGQLRAQLSAIEEPSSEVTVEELASVRAHRAQLTAAINETERDLDEALRSLGSSAPRLDPLA